MITPKELVNRRHSGRQPVAFDYLLKNDEPQAFGGADEVIFHFNKLQLTTNTWRVSLVFQPFGGGAERRLFEATFEPPKQNMPLEMVCATGLVLMKYQMAEMAQSCSLLDFMLGESIKGM